MCGLLGAVSARTLDIEGALKGLYPRGPDSQGQISQPPFQGGHCRLAILDLTDSGAQPMVSNCGRFYIVYNGEIYNFKEIRTNIGNQYEFKTNTDTEIVLASYILGGAKSVDQFRGMFAFAIWDNEKQSLFACRDRLGVKPFYYAHIGEDFLFSSRPRSLKKLRSDHSWTISKQAIRYFMEAGYVPAPLSSYEEIQKLPPGHYLTYSKSDGVRLTKYWSLDNVETDSSMLQRTEDSLLEELDALVKASVRLRLVSDVPVGVFLSGGIDSSLVVAMAAQEVSGSLSAFTIGFDSREFDESEHAISVAKHLGLEHHLKQLAPKDLLDLMPQFLSQYDEPFFDYSCFPVMAVSQLASKSVKVVLSGDGGDEAFGGYHYYRLISSFSKILGLPSVARKGLGSVLSALPQHKIQLLSALMQRSDLPTAFAFLRSVIKQHSRLISEELISETSGLEKLFQDRAKSFPKSISAAEMGMRLDTAFTLPDDYLQKVDLGSMAFSVEARDPLLDHVLFEWAAKLPTQWKIKGSTNKYLLRKLAYKYVPQDILDRPKMGFGVPMADWLKGPLKSWGENLISDNGLQLSLGLNPLEVKNLWESHQTGKIKAHTSLWTVLVLLSHFQGEARS